MSETMLDHAGHAPEFYAGYNGTCGQLALATALTAAYGFPADGASIQKYMAALAAEMYKLGWAAKNGAATLWALAQEARYRAGNGNVANGGFIVNYEHDYQEPLAIDWHQMLVDNAGARPIVLELARGRNLVDGETGARDEATLNYHAICILGKRPDENGQVGGYICTDGDNPQASSRFQIYRHDAIAAAVPCGLLILNMHRPAPAPQPQPAPVTPPPIPAPPAEVIPDDVKAALSTVAASLSTAQQAISKIVA